jgi:uncharacterized protein YheU (UPF0270 family)
MDQEPAEPVVVPHTELAEDLLRAVIESFVLREGTDYGEQEFSLDQKVAKVVRQLERGDAQIVFDPDTESVAIVVERCAGTPLFGQQFRFRVDGVFDIQEPVLVVEFDAKCVLRGGLNQHPPVVIGIMERRVSAPGRRLNVRHENSVTAQNLVHAVDVVGGEHGSLLAAGRHRIEPRHQGYGGGRSRDSELDPPAIAPHRPVANDLEAELLGVEQFGNRGVGHRDGNDVDADEFHEALPCLCGG